MVNSMENLEADLRMNVFLLLPGYQPKDMYTYVSYEFPFPSVSTQGTKDLSLLVIKINGHTCGQKIPKGNVMFSCPANRVQSKQPTHSTL